MCEDASISLLQLARSLAFGAIIYSILLKQDPVPVGFTNHSTNSGLEVTWTLPGIDLPEHALQLFASDVNGGVTIRTISVILCACMDEGTCLRDDSIIAQLKMDSNNHYKWPCNCSDFYGGESCEIDRRGCGIYSTCPDPTMCRNDPIMPSGYACDQCSTGYELVDGKCLGKGTSDIFYITYAWIHLHPPAMHIFKWLCLLVDIDECATSRPCGTNEMCTNTEGNYTCMCSPGFRRNLSSQTCEGKFYSIT